MDKLNLRRKYNGVIYGLLVRMPAKSYLGDENGLLELSDVDNDGSRSVGLLGL